MDKAVFSRARRSNHIGEREDHIQQKQNLFISK